MAIQRERDSDNTSLSYNNIGKSYAKQGNYDLALEYFYRSLRMREKRGYVRNQAISVVNRGKALKEKREFIGVIRSLEKGLAIREQLGSLPLIAETLVDICKLYNTQKKYSKAIYNCQRQLWHQS